MFCYHQIRAFQALWSMYQVRFGSLVLYSKLIQGRRDEKPHLAALQVPPDNQCNSELQAGPALPEPFRHQRSQQHHVGKFSNQIRVQKAQASALLFSKPWSSL